MVAASVSSDHDFIRSATMRHIHMGMPSVERSQLPSHQRRRIHIKQCFPTNTALPQATLSHDGLRMIPSCGQEEMDEMNSFETDVEMEEHGTDDTQQYSRPVLHSPIRHTSNPPSPDVASFVIHDDLRVPLLHTSTVIEDDSSLDDEEEYAMLINQGVLRPGSVDPSEEYVGIVHPTFAGVGGSRGDLDGENRDEQDIYPFAWALDGRNMNENTVHHQPRPTTPLVLSVCLSVNVSFIVLVSMAACRLFHCVLNIHEILDDQNDPHRLCSFHATTAPPPHTFMW